MKRTLSILLAIALLICCVHWFNPILWLGYVLYGRDVETACDQRVIRSFDRTDVAGYAAALLHLGRRNAVPRAVPLAFGEENGGFYDLKGYAEGLLHALSVTGESYAAKTDDPSFHPGRCAEIRCGDTVIGTIGQVHPSVCDTYDVGTPVYAALLSVEKMFECRAKETKFRPLPVFQSMERDLALLCDTDVEAGTLCGLIRSYGPKSLTDAFVFDVYQGKGVAEGKKSLAVRLTCRLPDRTMTDEEADTAVQKILRRLESENGIVLRS